MDSSSTPDLSQDVQQALLSTRTSDADKAAMQRGFDSLRARKLEEAAAAAAAAKQQATRATAWLDLVALQQAEAG